MNIIISGYGKMGRLIEERAGERGHGVVAIVDPALAGGASKTGAPGYGSLDDVQSGVLAKADLALDFTHPSVAADNVKAFAGKKIPLVVGTTGWELSEVVQAVKESGASLLYASNFSLGVNLFYRVAEYAARLFDQFEEYDVAGFEAHHNRKADSPSGTAKAVAEILLKNMGRKKKVVYEMLDRPPAQDELHFASVRVGAAPGAHTIYFDSPADTVEIVHTARNREGLASGAIVAAEWLFKTVAAGGRGIFTFADVLG
ncbi:MAG: 4-hydroxy-tetrahydrodipicolinate reductase [Spirochaetaceae bacterium]|jgi:4-hydroxy-tetrahydrodipicolinate reductase|nr:4-hydroxy-tetrahydrodipicolinate reductase [Spirochaetaceae bacterium]